MFCSKCGAQVAEGARFCNQCGTPVGGASQAADAGTDAPSQGAGGDGGKKTKKGISPRVIGIAIVVVVVLIVAGVALAFGTGWLPSDGEDAAEEQVAAEESEYQEEQVSTGEDESASEAFTSVEALGDKIEADAQEAWNSELTTVAVKDFVNEVYDCLPGNLDEAAVCAAVEDEWGYLAPQDKEELVECMADELLDELWYYKGHWSNVDVVVGVYEGDSLEADVLQDIELELAGYGTEYEVDDGIELEIVVTLTALEEYILWAADDGDSDSSPLEVGESTTDVIAYLDAIEIDGIWYLWRPWAW